MIKLLTALAALTMTVPAIAGTPHDFNPANVSTARGSLDGQCYTTEGENKVCFFRITDEIFAVSVNDASASTEWAQVFTVDCTSGTYKGYGPFNEANANGWATAFCKSGRY